MGNHLVVCDGCARHVRVGDTVCPFCQASVQRSSGVRVRAEGSIRLGRAALFAMGTAVLGASGCSESMEPTTDAGERDAMVDANVMDTGGPAPPYGAPPEPDAMVPDADLPDGASNAPAYGAPPMPDGGDS